MKYDFLSSWYEQDINVQRVNQIDALLFFIRSGIPAWITGSGFDEFKDAVHLFIHSKIWPTVSSVKYLTACGDTDALLIENIRSTNIWHGPFKLAAMPVSDAVNTALDTLPPLKNCSVGSLSAAFDMTFNNLARTQTRIILVHLMASLLGARVSFAGSDKLLHALYTQANQFQRNLLLFGAMLGEEKQKQAIEQVASQTVYSKARPAGFSLINHLSIDGHIPGYYSSELVDELEKEINNAVERVL